MAGGSHKKSVSWKGIGLKAIPAKDLLKSVRTLVWIPDPETEPGTIFHILKAQNWGLNIGSSRIVDLKVEKSGQQLIIIMDISINRKNFNLSIWFFDRNVNVDEIVCSRVWWTLNFHDVLSWIWEFNQGSWTLLFCRFTWFSLNRKHEPKINNLSFENPTDFH